MRADQWSKPAKAPRSQLAKEKAVSGWLYRGDAISFLATTMHLKCLCSKQIVALTLHASVPAVPTSALTPSLCFLQCPDGSSCNSKDSSRPVAPKPAVYLINKRAEQLQLIGKTHKGSEQTATKCQPFLSSAQPKEYFVLSP